MPDIESALDRLTTTLGFSVAWPIGPFWPDALTAGIGLGGLNFELLQPLNAEVAHPKLTHLVFEPTSLLEAELFCTERGLGYRIATKREPDPKLLALRGFGAEKAQTPQDICTNLYLDTPLPYPLFLCAYAEFLKRRLNPDGFPAPRGRVKGVTVAIEDPSCLEKWLSMAHYEGDIHLRGGEIDQIQFESGALDVRTLSLI